jgi:lysophospholipase L1-like esterase
MKLICFGDSLTRGVSYVKGRLRILKNNYPAYLQKFMSENQENPEIRHAEVVNKGVFNDNSDLLLARLEKDVIKEEPTYVIIGIGGNDCDFPWKEVAEKPNEEHQAKVPLVQYASNLKELISKLKSSGITPILTTLPPLDPARYYQTVSKRFGTEVSQWICKVGGIATWHSMYNRTVKNIAEEMDVFLIDVRNAIKSRGHLKDLISEDGIHLTEKGYKVMATEIYENLGKLSPHKVLQKQ